MDACLTSSSCSTWSSPPDLVAALALELHGFDLDPAASDEAHCAPTYYTPSSGAGRGGLRLPWWGRVWLNPPWVRTDPIGPWLAKAWREVETGRCELVCGLIPARTDTSWWHDFVAKAAEVRFIRGRLKYGNGPNSAPFPSAVVIWRRGYAGPPIFSLWRIPS